MTKVYSKSGALLKRSLNVIPTGSQTFSKSYLQYPENASPLFLSRGEGGRVWDVDGNQFVDLVNGLMPVVLGYKDKGVDAAIKQQLENGISFSLSTELEVELAELLVEIIPCAEMVRFGKNGSDATTAAIRLARAYTKKDRIAVCGYHGWHDWYVATTSRSLGVPKSVCELSHRFEYNNIDSLHQLFRSHPGEFAAVIMEPMNAVEPEPGFLEEVKALAHKAGVVLIFDEVITGFRYSLGGAQELFSVTPDLATFGKAMGNGMPISAVVGRADIMALFEEVFVSGTFGGETLSIAAAIAVIKKMKREPVIKDLWEKGSFLANKVRQIIEDLALSNVFSLSGKAPWMLLGVRDHQSATKELIKTIFIREMLANGVLMQVSHNVSYAHTQDDLHLVLDAYRNALALVKESLEGGRLEEHAAIEPVFQVR